MFNKILILINLIPLFLVILNSLTMPTIKPNKRAFIENSVDILLPMRNESENVVDSLTSATGNLNLNNSKIYVLDDNSTDNTAELVSRFSVKLITGKPLPPGWLGKNFACSQLAESGSGEFLVFLDADVRLSTLAIASSIAKMRKNGWDYISPYPRQIAGSLIEKLIQPLLQWSWLASVPLRIFELFPNRSMTIANGQFLIIKRSAYESIGGHGAIKSEVLDDLELARALVAEKFRGNVAEASSIASCRMYKSATSLKEGYAKSLWKAFGGISGTIIALSILIFTGVIPLLISSLALFIIILSRAISAIKTKSNPLMAILHPISIIYLSYLIFLSLLGHKRNTLQWRGRTV